MGGRQVSAQPVVNIDNESFPLLDMPRHHDPTILVLDNLCQSVNATSLGYCLHEGIVSLMIQNMNPYSPLHAVVSHHAGNSISLVSRNVVSEMVFPFCI